MNRIYQGRVSAVQIPKPGTKNEWESLANGEAVLWQHHELFQDAVNYYTLALAAMADGCAGTGFRETWIAASVARVEADASIKDKERAEAVESARAQANAQLTALVSWRDQVRENWLAGFRKAQRYDGPHKRLAVWLGVDASLAGERAAFDASAQAIINANGSSSEACGKALLQLLEEADQLDLNKLCVGRLPWLCTPHGKLDATPKNVAQAQESQMLGAIHEIHEADVSQISRLAAQLDLGCFVAQSPKERMAGAEARTEAERLFKSAAAKVKALGGIAAEFTKHLNEQGAQLTLPRLGRKPKGAYPLAAAFKLFPKVETWEAFKAATASLRKKAEKLKDAPVEVAADFIAEARTMADQPIFDYFTNRALFREPDDEDRAVWFDFDLAAFIEAIKSPHRYFQDTLSREKAAAVIRQKLADMEGRGGKPDDEQDEEDEFSGGFGFEKDERIALLRELVTDTLGYVAETENPGDNSGRIEYTIQERTLRGFEEIRERWRALAGNGQATPERLIAVLNEHQTKHRDDFGSATLYRELAKPKYHPIWRDAGSEKWHTADPLKAWRAYKELKFELADKERQIRFTPAHAEFSPRYFIIPKQGRFGSDHQSGQLAFTCGMVLQGEKGLVATEVRIAYSAPRLRRDALRSDGNEDLKSAPWLQPMMRALGLPDSDRQDFSNCRVTLQPASPANIQLAFPVEVSTEKLIAGIGKASLWNRQFNLHPDGDSFYNASLRWPHEKQPANPPVPWHDQVQSFSALATDLGQRDAGAFARVLVSSDGSLFKRPTRFIGKTGDKEWRAALERSGLFRLPGEDALVWREKSKLDESDPADSGKPFDFREEIWGERGRPARAWEADETDELMRLLEAVEKDADGWEQLTLLPNDWRKALSFPEQNDKLLVAMRRYQSRVARLHRWCWLLRSENKQQDAARAEIGDCDDTRLVTLELKSTIEKRDPRGLKALENQLRQRLNLAPRLLVRLANRVLPLRGRSWQWDKHALAKDENSIHQLTQSGPSLDCQERPVWLRGQRGLSLERIEQIEELRKRFQSLNQTLRRKIGGKPPMRRDETVPDPCPDLLEKLDHLKEQRVNQTAHMILAEALGLRLAPPPANKQALRAERDQHGAYEKIRDKAGSWTGPVDFIVIEDLSRYRASQGRAPRENSRLMKWCHRAVRDKLKQLCEVFGLPVLETPAAYSSRFCSRSGVPGFRAKEVIAGFTRQGQWAWLAGKKDEHGNPTAEAQRLRALDRVLVNAQAELARDWAGHKHPGQCPKRTLLVPLAGGPVFVPVSGGAADSELTPAVVQADINAAVNLALRAIANPKLWSIHPRLRTQREGGGKPDKGRKAKASASDASAESKLLTREKRKFGEVGKLMAVHHPPESKTDGTRQPNFFADFAGLEKLAQQLAQVDRDNIWLVKEWTTAQISEEAETPPLIHGKSFWGCVKAAQWRRICEINQARLTAWRDKAQGAEDIPM